MSASTRPVLPEAFAAAIKELSVPMLHLKVLEIRRSIAHLQYSNVQLKPFAEGTQTALGATTITEAAATGDATTGDPEPDQDCIEAIRENEAVLVRLGERLALIRAEVEERGMSWADFESENANGQDLGAEEPEAEVSGSTNGERPGDSQTQRDMHPAWTDGTFQIGSIRNGIVRMEPPASIARDVARISGGRLNDDELRRALEDTISNEGGDGNGEGGGGGMYL
ncbi:hypothetical protein AAL_00344 [Moelleriella libera RCEF 2490]|uniref:Secondary alcohol dehydrogenase n=1 Tax=Moelleriella libera RCEF 2490 TaxID=1081109 RepID=A0A166URP5_9HYPO|nr:hypothetical protein AAL_00344 [Moelleriella libera RCEF 2490]